MASQSNSDYELLTEHLGYPPVSLLDDIINTVNVLADRALDSVERLLISIPPQNLGFTASHLRQQQQDTSASGDTAQATRSPEDAAKLEIESGTHKLETLLTASIDRNFDKLELYAMQNILTVQPRDLLPHMRLAHYAGLDLSALPSPPADSQGSGDAVDTAAADRPTVESVTALRRRLQASQKLNIALHREKTRNDALLRDLREVLGVSAEGVKKEDGVEQESPSTFGFLSQGRAQLSSIGSQTPITTTTQFTLSQLQALRALSTSLRALLPDLSADSNPSSVAGDGGDSRESSVPGRKTWRRERAEYVEASSRKYLENSGGLELGKQGEVRDGEYQGEGRGLSKGDVEGLENAVAMLERGVQDDDRRTEGGEVRDGDAMDES